MGLFVKGLEALFDTVFGTNISGYGSTSRSGDCSSGSDTYYSEFMFPSANEPGYMTNDESQSSSNHSCYGCTSEDYKW